MNTAQIISLEDWKRSNEIKLSSKPRDIDFNSKSSVKTPVEALTKDQIIQLRDYFFGAEGYFKSMPNNRRNYLYIVLGFNFHRRCGDMCRLKIGDVIENDGSFKEHVLFREEKTGKTAVIKITESSKKAIKEYLDYISSYSLNDWLFPNFKTGGKMSVDGMRKMLKRTCNKLGFDGKYGTHSVRKAWAYEAINNAESISDEIAVSQSLNHRDVRTTYAYIGRKQAEMDDLLERNSL